jgi:3',5'-cyclic AMP phosphodiesterase CpdA
MIRIAHVSDLHVLSHTAGHWRSIVFNKRVTGYANLLLRRGRMHRREYLLSVLAAAADQSDHLVVTGDITNLSLEHEYEQAYGLLSDVARRTEVTVVPGNHDIYLPSTHEGRRFAHHFGGFLRTDLPEFACDLQAGPFPCVKLRGEVAFIALSSAVPRPPFIAAGYVGRPQLEALEQVLAHPAVRRRTPILLIHHPPVDDRPRLVLLRDGLVDGAALRNVLATLAHGLVLFGHLHVRRRCTLQTPSGTLDVIAASGAALCHQDAAVRAGFNLYVVDDSGRLVSVEAQVVDPATGRFDRRPLAAAVGVRLTEPCSPESQRAEQRRAS